MRILAFAAVTLITVAHAADMPKWPPFKRITAPAEPNAIPLYSGVAPGSPKQSPPEIWDEIMKERIVRNVSRPTLTPFLPEPSKATGAAVIVAPGGAFMMLAMANEGWPVAKALADRGIAAFVLKYRLDPTPDDEKAFEQAAGARFGAAAKAGADKVPPIDQPLATADGIAALKLVRARANEWHIDPNKVGIIGFSAGAMTALKVTLSASTGDRPNFTGLIYGPMTAVTTPEHAPPLFIALAANDPLFGRSGFGIVESWKNAGGAVEMHLYERGDHGFGMHHQNLTSDLWFDQFHAWMQMSVLKEHHE